MIPRSRMWFAASCRDSFNLSLNVEVWVAGMKLAVHLHPLGWSIGYLVSPSATAIYAGPISLHTHNLHVKEDIPE